MRSVASWGQQLLQGLLLPLPATRWLRVLPKLKRVDMLTAETLSLCNNLLSHQIMQQAHIPANETLS
jgi:hypothetical protein